MVRRPGVYLGRELIAILVTRAFVNSVRGFSRQEDCPRRPNTIAVLHRTYHAVKVMRTSTALLLELLAFLRHTAANWLESKTFLRLRGTA